MYRNLMDPFRKTLSGSIKLRLMEHTFNYGTHWYIVILDFAYNINSVYCDLYTFRYSTLLVPVLYLETVPLGVDPGGESQDEPL